MGLAGALTTDAAIGLLEEILFQRIVPAAGIMLFIGNVYYTWQAIRLTNETGHAYTAQPYGLNTAGGFPFIFGIIYGVFFSYQCAGDACTEDEEIDRVNTAWKVCVSANFITGLINIFLGIFGEYVMRFFPVAAMLVPLAGIGFTWLALNQIAGNFAVPAIGLIPVFLIFTQYYGLGRFHLFKGVYLPEAVPIVAFGCLAGWLYGTQGEVAKPVTGGAWIGGAFAEGFQDIGPYIGIVLPFSIAASFTDMMCLVSAQKAGDPFPIRETMITDGIGTLIGSFLGSPVGTVIYIGHPVHKRVGAKTGYSIMNGFIYLILTLTGVIPVILSVIPSIAIGPIIMIFGIMICEECTQHIPRRQHSAIFFGLFFGISDYIWTQYGPQGDGRAALIAANSGTYAMSKGSALASMIWSAIISYTVDRRWLSSAIFCTIAAFFAGIGIIHQENATFDGSFMVGTINKSTSSFEFMMGYLSMAALCLIYAFLQKYSGKKVKEGEEGYETDYGYLPPIQEPGVDDLFETWWDPIKKKEVDEEVDEEKAPEETPKEEAVES